MCFLVVVVLSLLFFVVFLCYVEVVGLFRSSRLLVVFVFLLFGLGKGLKLYISQSYTIHV